MTYYSGLRSSLPLQVLLVNTGNDFCISNIPTSNRNGECAFWLGYPSRECCRTPPAASLLHTPDLCLGTPEENVRIHPTTWSVISGYLGLGSCRNSEQAPSRALRGVLLAVNKWKVAESGAGLVWSSLLLLPGEAGVTQGLSHHPRAAPGRGSCPWTAPPVTAGYSFVQKGIAENFTLQRATTSRGKFNNYPSENN